MENEELYNKSHESINNLFRDTSVSKQATVENLYTLRDEINVMIDSIETEIDDEE